MSADDLKAPWELVSNVGEDGKPKEKEPDAGDYMSALSMLLGLVAFWFKVRCVCLAATCAAMFTSNPGSLAAQYKIFSWASLFTCLSAITRMKSADMDFTKVIAPLM